MGVRSKKLGRSIDDLIKSDKDTAVGGGEEPVIQFE